MAGSGAGPGRRRIGLTAIAAVAVGVGLFAVYRGTLLPGVDAWDTGEAQTVLPLLGTMHPTGFPAYALVGWVASVVLAPLGTPAFTINLLSAILIAAAAGLTVVVTRQLRVPLPIGVAAAVGFGLSPIVWHVSTGADAHALHAVLLVAIVALLLRWEALVRDAEAAPEDPRLRARADRAIVLAAAVFGVSIANHGLTLLLIPAVGLFVLAVDRPILSRRRVVAAALAACFGVAALLYLELPLRAGPFRAPLVYGHPETWSGFWDVVFARQFQGSVKPLADVAGRVEDVLHLAFAQFGAFLLLVPSGFLVAAVRHPRYALLSGVAAVTTIVFAATYSNAAIDRYYIGPVFFAWTWVAILGSAVVEFVVARFDLATERSPSARRSGVVALLTAIAVGIGLFLPTAVDLEHRRQAVDESGTVWVHQWLDEAFTTLEPDAVVLSWWSYSTPLWYGQLIEHRRPDIWIVDDRTRLDEDLGSISDVIEANLDTRPVYLIRSSPLEIQALSQRYVIEQVGPPGNLYRVIGRQEAHA